jgi:hypothetical protein
MASITRSFATLPARSPRHRILPWLRWGQLEHRTAIEAASALFRRTVEVPRPVRDQPGHWILAIDAADTPLHLRAKAV